MLNKAREFAVTAHGEQKYGDKPYRFHFDAVVELLESYGDDTKVIGYLHDVLEDTNVDFQTLKNEFGESVARRVALLTDEPGEIRRERKRKSYVDIARIKGEDELALVVLVADRLANIQACVADGDSRLTMYKSEQNEFYAAVHRPGLCDELWSAIDNALHS